MNDIQLLRTILLNSDRIADKQLKATGELHDAIKALERLKEQQRLINEDSQKLQSEYSILLTAKNIEKVLEGYNKREKSLQSNKSAGGFDDVEKPY